MKLLASVGTILLFSSLAQAATINDVKTLNCSNAEGSYYKLEKASGLIKGKLAKKTFDSESMRIAEVMESYPDDSTDALGGLVQGQIGFGNASILFTKQQSKNLKTTEKARAVFIDMSGEAIVENVNCQLKF